MLTSTRLPMAGTAAGKLLGEHNRSLPMAHQETWVRYWPTILIFVGIPLAMTVGVGLMGVASAGAASTGLMAGVGVLGGLLFQVLAWVSSRIGSIADNVEGRVATAQETTLVRRLDMTRANIAYSSLISILLVALMGLTSAIETPPTWLGLASVFLLGHLVANLVLVLFRINAIGNDDRVSALTSGARVGR